MNINVSQSVRFGDLTYQEIRMRAEQAWLAIVPMGCTEQQGPHLPVDFDTWFAEALMVATAEQAAREADIHTLVLPALPFGPTPEHRNYGAGYIDLPVELHDAVTLATLTSLARQGFRRIMIWRGCGGHDLQKVVESFNATHRGSAQAILPELPFYSIWCQVGDPHIPAGHADSFTTSISLYLRPQSVRHELISNPHSAQVDWHDPKLDFARYSATGVIGDPTYASAELGAKLWTQSINQAVQILKDAAQA